MNYSLRGLLAAVAALAVSVSACSDRNVGYAPVEPVDDTAVDITLTVYSDGWGTLLQTIHLDSEGPVTVDPPEVNPYSEPPAYYVYAHADGFYTELYHCVRGETIHVDLDAVPDLDDAVTGVIFVADPYFAHSYFAEQWVEIRTPDGDSVTVQTDHQGRYGLADIPTGMCFLNLTCQDEPYNFELPNSSGTDYLDVTLWGPIYARAPNLYLYPETTIDLTVTLGFPQGGEVVESSPPYGNGWRVRVEPDGTIDGQFPYLFYEARLPQSLRLEQGWLLDGGHLEAELRDLLLRLGFVGREIDDFVEYWVPELGGFPWLAVYPLNAETLVTVDISPAPARFLRALLYIRPLGIPVSIPAPPDPPPFVREGFVAAEWGVILAE